MSTRERWFKDGENSTTSFSYNTVMDGIIKNHEAGKIGISDAMVEGN